MLKRPASSWPLVNGSILHWIGLLGESDSSPYYRTPLWRCSPLASVSWSGPNSSLPAPLHAACYPLDLTRQQASKRSIPSTPSKWKADTSTPKWSIPPYYMLIGHQHDHQPCTSTTSLEGLSFRSWWCHVPRLANVSVPPPWALVLPFGGHDYTTSTAHARPRPTRLAGSTTCLL